MNRLSMMSLSAELKALVREPLPRDDEPWSATQLFETLRIAESHFRDKAVTPSWYCQLLADQIQHVSEEYAADRIDLARANRYVLMLLQHLQRLRARPRRLGRLARLLSWNRPAASVEVPPLVLRNLRLQEHMLAGMHLEHASFINCDFRRADLRDAKFQFCTFGACIFDGADVSRAIFERGEIQGCSFRRAALNQAQFKFARTLGCNFDDAMLEGAKGLA